jgi:kynureninase
MMFEMTKSGFNTSLELAQELDSKDNLAGYRERFVIPDPDLLYFDGNSLGRLTKGSLERARQVAEVWAGFDRIRRVVTEKRYEHFPV